MRKGTCIHFNGVMNQACSKGIAYDSFAPALPLRKELPCIRFFHSTLDPKKPTEQTWNGEKTCAFYAEPTDEQLSEQSKQFKRAIESMTEARRAIIEYTGGKRGVSGSIPCPVCRAGQLGFTVSGFNGHIHAQCSTPGCVNWME